MAVFVVNGLLIAAGAMAINNQQKEKKNQLVIEDLSANQVKDALAEAARAKLTAPAQNTPSSIESPKSINAMDVAPKKAVKNLTSTPSTTSAPKTVPTTTPTPAAKTKTS